MHQNLYRTQWPRVGNNVDYRDKRFVYGYVTPFSAIFLLLKCRALSHVLFRMFWPMSTFGISCALLTHAEVLKSNFQLGKAMRPR